jgi:hypothetical protein
MATFVLCNDGTRTFYVNADLVRTIEQKGSYTAVEFERGHIVNITERADYIPTATASGKRAI